MDAGHHWRVWGYLFDNAMIFYQLRLLRDRSMGCPSFGFSRGS